MMVKYTFVPSTTIYDKKLDMVEFELDLVAGKFYMVGSHFSIPIDMDGKSMSVHAGRQGVFNPIKEKK